MEKLSKKVLIALLALTFISGSLITYIAVEEIRNSQRTNKIHNEHFEKLKEILVEIASASNSGVSLNEWNKLYRNFSVASNLYKMDKDLNEEEYAAIEEINTSFRFTQDIWKVSTCYHTNTKCFDRFFSDIYEGLLRPNSTKKEYVKSMRKILKESYDNQTEKFKDEMVSIGLASTHLSIKGFFKLHDISL